MLKSFINCEWFLFLSFASKTSSFQLVVAVSNKNAPLIVWDWQNVITHVSISTIKFYKKLRQALWKC